jgi:hypothetical protein
VDYQDTLTLILLEKFSVHQVEVIGDVIMEMIMVSHQMVSKEHFMEYIQLEVNTMIVVMLHRKMELEQEVLELRQ